MNKRHFKLEIGNCKFLFFVFHFSIFTFQFLFLAPCSSLFAQEGVDEAREKTLTEYAKRAIEHYQAQEYARAIAYWEAILKLDPDQKQPAKLIAQARRKLAEQAAPLYQEAQSAWERGDYSVAREKMAKVLALDPTHPQWSKTSDRLEVISEIIESATGTAKVPLLIRKSISSYLYKNPNIRKSLNALRYAGDLSEDPAITKLYNLIAEENPELARAEEAPEGMNLIEHKLFLALSSIYKRDYPAAISLCDEVLELEPEDVLAMKRKGSAYYGLGQKKKAREIWEKALAIAPTDRELLKSLPKVR